MMPTTIFQKSTSWLLRPLAIIACLTVLVAQASALAAATTTAPDPTTNTPSSTLSSSNSPPIITVAGLIDHTIEINIFGIKPPPACAFSCKSLSAGSFTDGVAPCESVTAEEEKIKCLCTDRPYLKHIFNCIFVKCGPAMNDALAFGYNLCGKYDLHYPPPNEIIKTLELDAPPAIVLTSKIENVTFSNTIPPTEKGARASIGGYSVTQPFYSLTATPTASSAAVPSANINLTNFFIMGYVFLAGVIGGFLV